MDITSTLLIDAAPQPSPIAEATGRAQFERDAAAMYPEPKVKPIDKAPTPEVAALRAADPARVLYRPEDQYGSALREMSLAVNPLGTPEKHAEQEMAFANVAADVGFERSDISAMAATASVLAKNPPSAAEKATFQRTAVTKLREAYGDAWDERLKDTKLLVQRDGRLATFLERTGLGDDPTTILRLTELAQRARAKGQLKPAKK